MALPADNDLTTSSQVTLPTPIPQPTAGQRPTAPPARHPGRRRLYVLDGLRLLAALMVVLYHYVSYDTAKEWGVDSNAVRQSLPHRFAVYGWLGVYLFFLISGFVICMSCWNRTPRQFIVSRFVRLYPAYWFAIIVTTALVVLTPGHSTLRVSDVLTNATMMQGGLGVPNLDGVYWTLWAELRFYMLFAVVVVLGVNYRRVVAFCVVWMAAAVLAERAHNTLLTIVVEPDYAPFFIGGIGIYLMYRFGPRPELWLLIVASWLQGQFQLVTLVQDAMSHTVTPVSWTVSAALVAVFYAVLVAVATGRLEFLNWRWLTVAGTLTYPLYLIHDGIGLQVIRQAHDRVPPLVLVTGLVCAMLAASYLVHRLVEQPLARRLKDWLTPAAKAPAR